MKTDVDATSMSRRTGGSRPVTALGAALVGVGVVSALASHTPTPPDVQVPTVTADNGVRLAGNSVANIPTNLLQTIANMPAVEYEGMNKTSEALENSSNWWLYIPTNVIGFDQQDKQKLEGTTLMMVPIPLVAQANFEQWWITMAANAPMTENCTGIPGPCSDVFYFDQYGQVPTWQLVLGYRFPEIRNTIDPNHETYTTPEGKVVEIQPDWSGKYYKLDPWGPQKAIWETLTQDPTGYRPAPTADQWLKALNRLGKASWIGLNPNVEGTYCLPCQLGGIKGAPDSLPKQYLFGNYYSFFDFGQPQTEHNWVYNRPDYDEKSRLDYIEVRNGQDPKVQQQLLADARAATTPEALRESTAEFYKNMDAVGKQINENIAINIEGLQKAFGVTLESGQDFLDQIAESFGAQPKSASTQPRVEVRSQITMSSTRATQGYDERVAPSTAPNSAAPQVAHAKPATRPAPTDPFSTLRTQVADVSKQVSDAVAPLLPFGQHSSAHAAPGKHAAVDGFAGGKHRAVGVHRAS